MFIVREINGIVHTIELTTDEIEAVFRSKEHDYHKEDIFTTLEDSSYEYTNKQKKFIHQNIGSVIPRYEKNLSNGMDWEDAAEEAVNEKLKELQK